MGGDGVSKVGVLRDVDYKLKSNRMVRQYVQVTDQQRSQLVKLIHENKYSIAKASKVTNIPYDNAKAINRTYTREQRVKKINYK